MRVRRISPSSASALPQPGPRRRRTQESINRNVSPRPEIPQTGSTATDSVQPFAAQIVRKVVESFFCLRARGAKLLASARSNIEPVGLKPPPGPRREGYDHNGPLVPLGPPRSHSGKPVKKPPWPMKVFCFGTLVPGPKPCPRPLRENGA